MGAEVASGSIVGWGGNSPAGGQWKRNAEGAHLSESHPGPGPR